MQTVKITTSQNIDIDYEMAGLGDRIVARIIDYAIFYAVFIACIMVYTGIQAGSPIARRAGSNPFESLTFIITMGIWFGLVVFYDLICELFLNGQSIGKRAAKIKVISLTGARPGVGQYLLRWIFRIVDFGLTGGTCAICCVAFSDNKQRVGDMVAGTTLIRTSLKNKFEDLVFRPTPEDYVPTYTEVSQLTDRDITLIHDVIRNFNRTRNSGLVYRLALRLKAVLNVTYPPEINEYQFLEIVLNDYNVIVTRNVV